MFTSLLLAASISSAIVELDWTVGWVHDVNATGSFVRSAIGINNQWPIPPIHAYHGDTLVVRLQNNLNETTSLHFHGLFQNGTTYYDGAMGVNQCGIAPGGNYTYKVPLNQIGSYWVHGHNSGQYPDGFRTPLVIHDVNERKQLAYDDEYTLGLSDWYQRYYKDLFENEFFIEFNGEGVEPVPTEPLINDAPGQVFKLVPGKTYRFRFISMATFATFNMWIEDHEMTVIEVDGVLVKPYKAQVVPVAAAQRYSVLITAKNDAKFNYKLRCDFDEDMFGEFPPNYVKSVTAKLLYDDQLPDYEYAGEDPDVSTFKELEIEPLEKMSGVKPDVSLLYKVIIGKFTDKRNHATFDFIPFQFPKVPPIFTAMTTGSNASDTAVYGPYTNTKVLPHNQMIELVIRNLDREGGHPFHLHGHVFQIMGRGSTPYLNMTEKSPIFDALPNPLRRDTVTIPARGWAVIRFRADNPGVWLFHCHIQWHLSTGLMSTIIEAPELIQKQNIPADMIEQCRLQKTPISGNAAGFMDKETFSGLEIPPKYILE